VGYEVRCERPSGSFVLLLQRHGGEQVNQRPRASMVRASQAG